MDLPKKFEFYTTRKNFIYTAIKEENESYTVEWGEEDDRKSLTDFYKKENVEKFIEKEYWIIIDVLEEDDDKEDGIRFLKNEISNLQQVIIDTRNERNSLDDLIDTYYDRLDEISDKYEKLLKRGDK